MSLIKFRAGKVTYDVSSKTATALPVQGQITIKPSQEDDSFFSFEWSPKDNVVNIEKDEFLIIPGDASWTHIEGCKTGRVFALEFVSSGARHLFWMQEVNDNDDDPSELSKKDQEITQKIKSLLEIPEDEEEEEEGEEEVEEAQQSEQSSLAKLFSLTDLLDKENIDEALARATEEDLQKLYSHIPPSMEHNVENLKDVLLSPYFKRSAANLSEAMFGGGYVVCKALGVNYLGEGVTPYLKSVKDEAEREKDEGKK